MRIAFVVDGVPVAQPRPRVATRDRRGRVLDKPHAYEAPRDHPIHEWKRAVAVAALPFRPREPIDEPIWLRLWFSFPPKRERVWHTQRPDADNLAKPIMDALTELGFWRDDALIYELRVRKVHATNAANVGVAVAIHVRGAAVARERLAGAAS